MPHTKTTTKLAEAERRLAAAYKAGESIESFVSEIKEIVTEMIIQDASLEYPPRGHTITITFEGFPEAHLCSYLLSLLKEYGGHE